MSLRQTSIHDVGSRGLTLVPPTRRPALVPLLLCGLLINVAVPAAKSGPIKDSITTRSVVLPVPLQSNQTSFCTWGTCPLGPRLFHAPISGGTTLIGWTDNLGNGHVTKVPDAGAPTTWNFAGEAVRGLVGHDGGSFAVLLHMPSTNGIRLSKRDASGAQIWSAPLNTTMAKPDFLVGDARLAYGNGQYDAYFAVKGLPGCFCDTHNGDQYSTVTDAGVVQLVWFWGPSAHSMAQLAGYHPGLNIHTLASVSDCFPQKGLFADGSHLLLEADADCNGRVSVQLGGMAAGAERWAVAFNGMTSGSFVGHGAGIAFFGASYAPTIVWLTGTSGLWERDASIARLGTPNTPERFLAGWLQSDTGVHMLAVTDSVGAIVEGPEEVTSTGVQWGARDDSFRTRPDGSVSWVEGQAGSSTLNIHTYEPPALSAVDDNLLRSRLEIAAAPNPLGSRTTINVYGASSGPATLLIYDLEGRIVRRLFDGAGLRDGQSFEWDGRDDRGGLVGSGAYVAQITARDEKATSKLIVVR